MRHVQIIVCFISAAAAQFGPLPDYLKGMGVPLNLNDTAYEKLLNTVRGQMKKTMEEENERAKNLNIKETEPPTVLRNTKQIKNDDLSIFGGYIHITYRPIRKFNLSIFKDIANGDKKPFISAPEPPKKHDHSVIGGNPPKDYTNDLMDLPNLSIYNNHLPPFNATEYLMPQIQTRGILDGDEVKKQAELFDLATSYGDEDTKKDWRSSGSRNLGQLLLCVFLCLAVTLYVI